MNHGFCGEEYNDLCVLLALVGTGSFVLAATDLTHLARAEALQTCVGLLFKILEVKFGSLERTRWKVTSTFSFKSASY